MNIKEDVLVNEIWYGSNVIKKIACKILKKDFIKMYKKGLKEGFNWSNNVR